jgi:hypothetical protein
MFPRVNLPALGVRANPSDGPHVQRERPGRLHAEAQGRGGVGGSVTTGPCSAASLDACRLCSGGRSNPSDAPHVQRELPSVGAAGGGTLGRLSRGCPREPAEQPYAYCVGTPPPSPIGTLSEEGRFHGLIHDVKDRTARAPMSNGRPCRPHARKSAGVQNEIRTGEPKSSGTYDCHASLREGGDCAVDRQD